MIHKHIQMSFAINNTGTLTIRCFKWKGQFSDTATVRWNPVISLHLLTSNFLWPDQASLISAGNWGVGQNWAVLYSPDLCGLKSILWGAISVFGVGRGKCSACFWRAVCWLMCFCIVSQTLLGLSAVTFCVNCTTILLFLLCWYSREWGELKNFLLSRVFLWVKIMYSGLADALGCVPLPLCL